MRTRAERRFLNRKKALRKRFITRNVYGECEQDYDPIWNEYSSFLKKKEERRKRGPDKFDYYSSLNQFSKNKIHFSSSWGKTNTRKYKDWSSCNKNWSASDKRKLDRLYLQINEFDI